MKKLGKNQEGPEPDYGKEIRSNSKRLTADLN